MVVNEKIIRAVRQIILHSYSSHLAVETVILPYIRLVTVAPPLPKAQFLAPCKLQMLHPQRTLIGILARHNQTHWKTVTFIQHLTIKFVS